MRAETKRRKHLPFLKIWILLGIFLTSVFIGRFIVDLFYIAW